MNTLEEQYRPVLEAVSFAARAHQGQLRKDGRTPYASHPSRVCLIAAHVFGIDDPVTLTAAALHDTLEDTATDFDDLSQRFGPEVARWVGLLSKDPRMEEARREEAYKKQLASAPWQVKVCKMADVFDNLMDSRHFPPDRFRRARQKYLGYLDALDAPDLPEPARRALDTVRRLAAELENRVV